MFNIIDLRPTLAAFALTALLGGPALVQAQPSPEQMQQSQKQMKKMMQMYTPELRKRVQALSPATKMEVLKIFSQHTRHSDQVTFRQVMHEVLADYQAIAAAIATDNGEAAARAARRLANHTIPKGGLFPYFKLDEINDKDMGVLPAMNTAVEGSALKLAEAADQGDMTTAASHLSNIMTGCVACHQMFRGRPGVSNKLIDKK
ncbi:MAG: hypothetical protein SV201_03450 [Pseudomonadota bacterium]|nr:hypothetical protein [Pseudomonadota bacterium]